MSAFPSEGRVVVQNVNMVTRHTKPRKQGEQGAASTRKAPSTHPT